MISENELIILIGAGCSKDAEIPTSSDMVGDLLNKLETEEDWKRFRDLYYCLKSAVLYADGLDGYVEDNFDIEKLVIVLTELEKKENCLLYPFIGSWNPRLLELAQYDFKIIGELKNRILEQLNRWVNIEDYGKASYYSRFFDFQSLYNYSLRLFSLNYDLCLEKNTPREKNLELGFDPETRYWEWKRFEPADEEQPEIYFYKMHGSINWKREKEHGDVLREVDTTPDIPDLIFGTEYKMQYIDPYLFYAYELRKYSLSAEIIVTIGYGFRDEHINGILEQALKNDRERKLLIISPDADKLREKFPGLSNQLIARNEGAKEFLQSDAFTPDMIAKVAGIETEGFPDEL